MKRYIRSSSEDKFQEALQLINDYCNEEYLAPDDEELYDVGKDADLSDIGIMYTTAGDSNEVSLEISADLENYTMNYYVNGELRHTDKFKDLQDFIDRALSSLDFDSLYSTALDYVTDSDYTE